MSELSLRAATSDDAERIRALVRAAYSVYVERMGREPRPMLEDYTEVIAAKDATVAERAGEIVGVVVLEAVAGGEVHDDSTERAFVVDNLAVDPAVKGTGVGRALLEHADVQARAAGFDTIHLYTHEKMTENIALYGRIGYVEYARIPYGSDLLVFLRKRL